MGLHWSTPRVLGVGYTAHLGPRRSVGCLPMLAFFFALGVLIEAARALIHVWYVTVPLLVLLFVAVRWSKHRQAVVGQAPTNQSQASVSNRR